MRRVFQLGLNAKLKALDEQLSGYRAVHVSALFFVLPLFAVFNWLAHFATLPIAHDFLLEVSIGAPLINALGYLVMRPIIGSRSGRWTPGKLLAGYVVANLPSELFKVTILGIPWVPSLASTSGPGAVAVVLTSLGVGIFWFLALNLAITWALETRRSISKLQAGYLVLVQIREKSAEQLQIEFESLKIRIDHSIGDSLRSLADKVLAVNRDDSMGLAEASSKIRDFCNREVRSLSHAISEQTSIRFDPQVGKLRFAALFRTILKDADVRPAPLAVSLLVLAVPYALNFGGRLFLLVTLLGIGLGWLVVERLDRVRRVRFGSQGWRGFVSAFFMYLMIAVLGTQIVRQIIPTFPTLEPFIATLDWLLPSILIALWLILGFIFGAREAFESARHNLEKQNAQLEIETQKLDRSVQEIRRRAYRVLHGSVQGRLAAVSLALSAARDQKDPATADTLLAQAREQLSLARSDIAGIFTGQMNQVLDLKVEIEQVVASWLNLLEIRVEISPEAQDYLNDYDANLLIGELRDTFQEALTNAYRHAMARSV